MSMVATLRPRLGSRWQAFEAWAGTRTSAIALFVVALALFAIESAFLPAYPGRDMARYLQAFVQLGYHVPVYPAVLNTRGPLAALGVGVPLELGGWAAEIWLALLYALSIVAWARVALTFGARAAVVVSVLLLVDADYAILFHQLASDSLFAAAFAGWALLVRRALLGPSVKAFLVVGVAGGVLVLVRPANQVLLILALLPLLVRASWRAKVAWAAAWFVPAVAVSQTWHAYAHWRWGSVVTVNVSLGLVALAVVLTPLLLPRRWGLRAGAAVALLVVVAVAVRGWPGQSPSHYVQSVKVNESNQFLYRAFELDKIIAPENGPASRKVANIVRQQLLTRDPYRSYGVGVHEFFASGSDRVFGDMTGVVPASDLAGATREAIRRRPGTFASSIGNTLWQELALRPVYAPVPMKPSTPVPATQPSAQSPPQYVVVHGRRLPKPSEGQPIPSSAIGPALLTTHGSATEVWTSPTEHHTVITDAADRRRIDRFDAATARLAARLPTRDGNASVIHRLNQAAHAFPPPIFWLVLGLASLLFRRPRAALVALAPTFGAAIVILVTVLVAPSIAEYGAPVSPAFLLLTAAGLVGLPRGEQPVLSAQTRRRLAAVTPLVAFAVGVAAVAWVVKIYYDSVRVYTGPGAGAPHDLAVFLAAAGKVLHGASPYVFMGDRTFAYPPFLAYLVSPLHPLSGAAAGMLWMFLSLGLVVLSLWWLELRDWRCYALAVVFTFTRSAIDLGTVEPLLLLCVAATWRWRDRVVQPALATGAAIVLKLFLWPLVVWFALTRRVRAAAAAVGVTIVLALVSWAAIGFAGVGEYAHVLRKVADHESTSSYSVVALGVRAHLPLVAARIVSILVALGLLAAAAWVARDGRRTARGRDVATLTLTLAAALAASPIVWVHYFLVLLVPLALTRPRLSALWLVPLAYYPLGEAAWPAGDARKLGLALVATLIVLGAAVVRGAGDAPAAAPEPHRSRRFVRNPALRLLPWSRIRSGA